MVQETAGNGPEKAQDSAETSRRVKRTPEEKAARKVKRDAAAKREAAGNDPRKEQDSAADSGYSHYVHLANGDVLRVKEEDVPQGGGTGTPHGHVEKDGHVYVVTGVYPVEVKKGQ